MDTTKTFLTPYDLPPLGLPFDLKFDRVIMNYDYTVGIGFAFFLDGVRQHLLMIPMGQMETWVTWRHFPRYLAANNWRQTTLGNGFVYHAETVIDDAQLTKWREYTEQFGKAFKANEPIEFYA